MTDSLSVGLLCHASCGGSARIATELSRELAERGHQVHLFTLTTPFAGARDAVPGLSRHQAVPDEAVRRHPASLYVDWTREELEAYTSLILDVIAGQGLDVLHFHYALPFAFVAAEIKRRLGSSAPLLVGTLHGTDVSIHGREARSAARLVGALAAAELLTTVSHSHARLAAEVFGLPVLPRVIPNFLDLDRFRPTASGAHGSNGAATSGRNGRSPARIVHVSNFRPVKDTVSAIRIFRGIAERVEADLWLVGDGEEMGEVRALCGQLDLGRYVRFWGLQHDVAPLLAASDLALVTSRAESFCLAALEAMACGVPVLAPSLGGLPEVVRDGTTGLLYPPLDQATAIHFGVRLLSDPAVRGAMGAAAAVHARQYDRTLVVPAYEAAYRQLLATRQPAPSRT